MFISFYQVNDTIRCYIFFIFLVDYKKIELNNITYINVV
jgi:hypothetical protein